MYSCTGRLNFAAPYKLHVPYMPICRRTVPGHKSRIAAGGKKLADVDNRSLRLPRKIDNRGKASQSRRPEPYRLAAKFGQAAGQGAES